MVASSVLSDDSLSASLSSSKSAEDSATSLCDSVFSTESVGLSFETATPNIGELIGFAVLKLVLNWWRLR